MSYRRKINDRHTHGRTFLDEMDDQYNYEGSDLQESGDIKNEYPEPSDGSIDDETASYIASDDPDYKAGNADVDAYEDTRADESGYEAENAGDSDLYETEDHYVEESRDSYSAEEFGLDTSGNNKAADHIGEPSDSSIESDDYSEPSGYVSDASEEEPDKVYIRPGKTVDETDDFFDDEEEPQKSKRSVSDIAAASAAAVAGFFGKIGKSVGGFFKRGGEAEVDSRADDYEYETPRSSREPVSRQGADDGSATTVFTGADRLKDDIPGEDGKKTAHDVPVIPPAQLRGKGKASVSLFKPRDSRPPFILGVIITTVKIAAIALIVLAAAGIGAVFGVANAYLGTTPELNLAQISDQSLTSYIYDSNGKLITSYAGLENRDYATLDEIPKLLQEAVIATEDVRFYHHNGVDIKGLTNAFLGSVSGGTTRGGSTITQQLIKNQLLSSERSYKRKIQEASLALQLEKKYTKDQILEAYLNTIHLGGTNYGVKAAAKDYFGKSLNQLTLREMACLAGITQYPYLYNPRSAYYVTNKVDALNKRINAVLTKMYRAGYITLEQMNEAMNDSFKVIEKSATTEIYSMPHFTEYAVYDVVTHMLRKEGLEDNSQNRSTMENKLRTGGYNIYSTVDPDMQNTLQTTASEWKKYPKFADKGNSIKVTTDSSGNTMQIIEPQVSAVIVDQKTGYIKALIGSRDTPTSKKTLNRAYQARMSVGSSIKPLLVYGPAFDKGYGLATSVANVPVPIDGWDSDKGYPVTSSGGSYGWVSIRKGITSSLNIVAARTVMELTTVNTAYEYVGKLGISYDRINKNGVGLALGTSGISSLEMAGGYACIANGGVYVEPVAFTKVTDRSGNDYLKATDYQDTHRVYKASTAYMLVDALTQAVKSGTGTRARIKGITVAGKTGTTPKCKGVFFSGITGYYVSTLWVGHDDDKAFVSGTVGGNGAAPLWQAYMSKILEGKEDKPILEGTAEDYGVVKATICALSGYKATSACSEDSWHPAVTDYMPADSPFLQESCDWHTTSTVCAESGMLPTEYCPETRSSGIVEIPDDSPYAKWSSSDLNKYIPNRQGSSETCNIHTAEWAAQQEALKAAIADAQTAISNANAFLSQYSSRMTAGQISKLNSLISSAQTAIDSAKTAEEVTAAATKLNNAVANVQANLGPEPTPSPEPTPEPDINNPANIESSN